MSANNAPGEVNKDKFFDSPNISSAEDEIEEPEVDKEAEERKKRETVEIDGVPIEGKEIKYKAEDIKKKSKMNYFVDVEGAENRAKNEAKKAEEEKAAAEKKAAEEKKSAERKVKEAEADANRKVVEEKKHLEEVNAYIKRQRKQNKSSKAREERNTRFASMFWTGKRKLILPGILIGIVVICAVAGLIFGALEKKRQEEELLAQDNKDAQEHVERTEKNQYYQATASLDESEDLRNALDNYDYVTIDLIYQEFLDKAETATDKAKLYADEARRIWRNDNEEKERIYQLAAMAYELDNEDLDVLQILQSIYTSYGDSEKNNEVFEQMQKVLEKQASENPAEDNSGKVEG